MSRDIVTSAGKRLQASVRRLQQGMRSAVEARPGELRLATRLVDLADAVEHAVSAVLGVARRLLRSGVVRLSGGIAWRGLAAATGIGLTATLATSLSSGSSESEPARAGPPEAQQASGAVRDVRIQAVPSAALQEEWITVARPIALFGVEAPDLGKRGVYEARRSQDGSQREDWLSFGAFAEDKPHLAVKIHLNRNGAPEGEQPEAAQPFVIALVRESAARGLSIGRSGALHTIETKFGTVETADIGLSDGEAGRACIGFRHRDAGAQFSFSGWWCGTEARPADRAQLICLIDRVDLLSAGDNPELRATFARTELNRRTGCSVPRLAASGRKGSWLDADAKAPPLRSAAHKPSQTR